MSMRKILFSSALGLATFLIQAIEHAPVFAQSSTTGAIRGAVKDKKTGEPIPGVTIIATSASMPGNQTAITDESGSYLLTTLTPGTYTVSFFYGESQVNATGVVVNANQSTNLYQKIDQENTGEVIEVKSHVVIDTTSTTQGVKLDKEYIKNVPIAGRSFEGAMLAAPATRGDGVGVSVSGSSSLENNYIIDGVNTNSLTLGTAGSPVINDFFEELEVITGGYNAEYGRSTGGVVSVVTKSGTNKFQGSVFAYLQPGALVGRRDRTPSQVSPIDVAANVGYNYNVGFELGGPIVKDKLLFYVGFAPTFVRTDMTRRVSSNTDCRTRLENGTLSECNPAKTQDGGYADGAPDKDPATGLFLTDKIEETTRYTNAQAYSMIGKLNFIVTPNQQGQLTLNATPSSAGGPNVFGAATAATKSTSLQSDVAGKWTSKFNNNKTEIEATVGWHRQDVEETANDPAAANTPLQILRGGSLAKWGVLGGESDLVLERCRDSVANDRYSLISNCQVTTSGGYIIGGPGSFGRELEDRRSAKVSFVQRVKALGSHEIKAGGDVEVNRLTSSRLLSGGAFYDNSFGSTQQISATRFVSIAPPNTTDPRFDSKCRTKNPEASGGPGGNAPLELTCDFLDGVPGTPGTEVGSETLNLSAYLRDSWQIRPNFTVNFGVRYEEQRLRYAAQLQNGIDPVTGERLGKNAMELTGLFAPRLGFVYDWTKEGKSKFYGNWGRYYESIPLQINKRSFGAEVTYQQVFDSRTCGTTDPRLGGVDGNSCLKDPNAKATLQEKLLGASGVIVAPGIDAQYMDEALLGVEYELVENLKVSAAFSRRTLGRVIEDVSTDGANTYIIANPGEITDSDLNSLRGRIERASGAEKTRLEKQLTLLEGVKTFDKPVRDYNSLVLTMQRRMAKNFLVLASYTFSQTKGNYPGLISYSNGQLDPNISSQYDLVELLANRNGFLEQDTPHNLKLNGYYTFEMKKAGSLTVGLTASVASGQPYGALGAHFSYGQSESFLLPRGSVGRTAMDRRLNLQLQYSKKFGGNNLDVFLTLFNIMDYQGGAAIDDTYAIDTDGSNNSNPIVGGTYQDLIWAKTVNSSGEERKTPLQRNPNYGNIAGRYAPISARFGLRFSF